MDSEASSKLVSGPRRDSNSSPIEAGYVHIERPVSDRRRRVRARLTPAGRKAFRGHVAALRAIVGTPG
jgi:hypothetical protein